jgi:hypothetical protein
MLSAGWAEPATSIARWQHQCSSYGRRTEPADLVIDYRKLNEITIKDSYPLPAHRRNDGPDPRIRNLYQVRSEIGLQPDPNPTRRRMENHIHDPLRSLPTPCNDLWIYECTAMFPTIHGQGVRPVLYKNLENYLDDITQSPSDRTSEHVTGVRTHSSACGKPNYSATRRSASSTNRKSSSWGSILAKWVRNGRERKPLSSRNGNDQHQYVACVSSSGL